jgi:Eisosome component PIL1
LNPGHALRKQTAGQWGPELARKLSQLVKMEKNVMRSMELVGRERMEVAVGSSPLSSSPRL